MSFYVTQNDFRNVFSLQNSKKGNINVKSWFFNLYKKTTKQHNIYFYKFFKLFRKMFIVIIIKINRKKVKGSYTFIWLININKLHICLQIRRYIIGSTTNAFENIITMIYFQNN